MRKYNDIYQLFHDMFSKKLLIKFMIIPENMDHLTIHELAKLMGYSERNIRQIVNEVKDGLKILAICIRRRNLMDGTTFGDLLNGYIYRY